MKVYYINSDRRKTNCGQKIKITPSAQELSQSKLCGVIKIDIIVQTVD